MDPREGEGKDFDLVKVPGNENYADIMTKFVDKQTLLRHLDGLGLREEGGRAHSAAHLV